MKIFHSAFTLFFPFIYAAKDHPTTHLRARQNLETDTTTEVELVTGVTSDAYNVGTDKSMTFYVNVKNPATVTCETNGDNGDLDLDTSWYSPGQYGCYSSTPATSIETCSLGVGIGRAYATVYGLSDTSSFTITCTVQEVSFTELKSGVQAGPYELAMDDSKVFSIDVIDSSTIICQADGSSSTAGMIGVLNLNMKNNTYEQYCGSGVDSNAVNCIAGPTTGRVLLTLSAYDSVKNVTIKCLAQKFLPTPIKDAELRNGEQAGPYNLAIGESFDFFMKVSSMSLVRCETNGSIGDLDLYMKWENATDYECAATSGSAMEMCMLSPNTGIAKINLQGFSTVIGFSITCTEQKYIPSAVENPELANGIQSGPYNVLADESLDFFMNIPSSSVVSCETYGSEGDFYSTSGGLTLNMSWDDSANDGCISDGYSMVQSCFLKPSSGIAKIQVRGTSMSIGFYIRCTAQEFSPSIIENPVLADGVVTGPYNLSIGDSVDFYMDITSLSTISCETAGSNGALYLHMFWGNRSETGCYSAGGDSSMESCMLGPNTGRATISISGYSTVIGYSISCTAHEVSSMKIESAVTSNLSEVSNGEVAVFLLDVPILSSIQCVLNGEGSDYANFHLSWKDSRGYECLTQGSPASLECSVGPGSGEAYAWVESQYAVSNVAVTCTSTPIATTNITLGVPSGPHTIPSGEYLHFVIPNVASDSEVVCQTSADSGYLSLNMNSDGSDLYDCSSDSMSSMESCSLVSHSGSVFAIVYAYDAVEKLTIECTD